ncbi:MULTISPECIES: PilW family protein [unclassified Acinetobacter]|uniref:PilW family protein n=1 Tax=unclassified Acinetobacter TaxID=196816 RepID=UPI002934F872|nr:MULTISPECIES: prepilin-type N-terminal cleavage/methylation domain-containing protein [unclassified Acinetobacter]WOE31090.1 prepilin-type N-terminal cleavage/methylation domain-containing protein [Acinetobacter sp. SAAs470]WOE39286.1 prepilin-type N-terminal cleavage/methylation domain-containing protein [Acinetobacter sp. SAAs474]
MIRPYGFTLIELMISLTLGLVIIAAAVMLFLTAIRSQSLQQGIMDLQDNANFGLNDMTRDIRLANLNAATAIIDDRLRFGGIVLSAQNLPAEFSDVDPVFLSSAQTGISNVKQASDQLVIQYQPMTAGGFDCEGRQIAAHQVVIQRYFLRKDHHAAPTEPHSLALVCDAGHYIKDQSIAIQNNRGLQGEIIMKHVDHFRVLLSVINQHRQRRYIAINDYMALKEEPKPRILGVYLAILMHSPQMGIKHGLSTAAVKLWLLDQQLHVKHDKRPNPYVYRVVAQEVAFRNALGELN